jgi:hypothetical protein
MCVDRYKPARRHDRVPAPKYGPARASVTVMQATQAGRFTIAGPSSNGPFTIETGADWYGSTWGVTGPGAGGNNLGLG